MIIFENSIIKLDYDPATDIVVIEYPSLYGYLLPEIKHSLDILTDTVRSYDIKRVLLDASRTTVSVTPEESRELTVYLAGALARTRVRKLARVQSLDTTVETRATENIAHVQQEFTLPYLLQSFTQKAEALAWLQDESVTDRI
ncbi:hypothetical protein [Pontibacter akesuensis]|uniref:SpoIIAA-like n=1 Tax=Pontibacter akesuensis TaxID=388950 RepID=A0A1I7KQB4_9BACT|nr:hypothetical protein [Pontibacter akesuensis]GHA81454.1 hypothetical protein GCM10007389_40030 [Pontibacter akesuensis]SFU99601.1 hypothetical protein SAMN04487941_3978 [Pontibacter akesuensis]